MERVQAAYNNHWGLKRQGSLTWIIDKLLYLGVRYNTCTYTTQNTKRKKKKKLVEKERQEKKAKFVSI